MTRKILIAILVTAILAGCSKDDTPAPPVASAYLVATVLDMNAGNFKLVKFNTDGSGEAAFISSRIDVGNEFAVPAISPKGKKVVYFEGGVMKLMNVKTDARTIVYSHPNTYIGCPSFSADESKIVFSASPTGDDRADIYVVTAAENATPVKITNNALDFLAIYPKFNSDASKITFVNGQMDNGGIYVSDQTGANVVRVSEAHQAGDDDVFPVFTIDGSKVIYSSSKNGQANNTYELFVSTIAEAAEGTATRMFEATASGVLGSFYPVVSPEGSFIYFMGVDATGAQNVYKVPITGGNPVKLKTVVATDDDFMVVNLTYVQE